MRNTSNSSSSRHIDLDQIVQTRRQAAGSSSRSSLWDGSARVPTGGIARSGTDRGAAGTSQGPWQELQQPASGVIRLTAFCIDAHGRAYAFVSSSSTGQCSNYYLSNPSINELTAIDNRFALSLIKSGYRSTLQCHFKTSSEVFAALINESGIR